LFSSTCGGESAVLAMHCGNGDMGDLPQRFYDCFVAALDDAELPDDPEFRAALHAYMRWAVDNVMSYSAVGTSVPEGLPMPHWTWAGLEKAS